MDSCNQSFPVCLGVFNPHPLPTYPQNALYCMVDQTLVKIPIKTSHKMILPLDHNNAP